MPARDRRSKLFITYRREDSAGHAGRLYDRLSGHFGAERIFMDIDTIRPGEDFVSVLQNAVASCEILIAVIGRYWLAAASGGVRRIDRPDDFVRLEILAALDRGITVIPVLVHGAGMPRPEELPAELEPLTRRQAVELSDTRWGYDVSKLINTLEEELDAKLSGETPVPSWKSRLAAWASGLRVKAGGAWERARRHPLRKRAAPVIIALPAIVLAVLAAWDISLFRPKGSGDNVNAVSPPATPAAAGVGDDPCVNPAHVAWAVKATIQNTDVDKLRAAKVLLKKMHFYDGEPDGPVNEQFVEAVCEFQKAAGLAPDGALGRETYQEMTRYLR
jgi:TIR domain/Putative peptidoglycan binding domain